MKSKAAYQFLSSIMKTFKLEHIYYDIVIEIGENTLRSALYQSFAKEPTRRKKDKESKFQSVATIVS